MPQRSERFRVNIATLAIFNHDGESLPIRVPTGALVKLVNGPLDSSRLVNVKWEDKTVMMFATDIREHCAKLEDV
jgi:hypothetical protein